ncbi:MAG: NAD(P)H-dependent oxidoreductase [Lachnospiraceae bacterium]|nr:NAD(P)H-dependent oxidoreductase [Lachnospiraceae bacterium]
MIITAIEGSPKPKDSNSSKYLSVVTKQLESEHTVKTYSVARSPLSEEAIASIMQSDILLLACPLYVDGIPVNLLTQMIALEHAFHERNHVDTMVYVIVNNGFYEGEQNVNAIEMVSHFCKRAGITFGQGIGIGAGEMQGQMTSQGMPVGKAVLTNLGNTLDVLIQNIRERKSAPNLYVRPNFPWHGFQFMSHQTFWKPKAKANHISVKDMNRRLEYQRR